MLTEKNNEGKRDLMLHGTWDYNSHTQNAMNGKEILSGWAASSSEKDRQLSLKKLCAIPVIFSFDFPFFCMCDAEIEFET